MLKKSMVLAVFALATGCSVTPVPIGEQEITQVGFDDQRRIINSQIPITGKVSLAEAMSRSLKYNLDHHVQLMENAIAHKSFELSKLDMLPVLSSSAAYLDRSNTSASRSLLLDADGNVTPQEGDAQSTSQDRHHTVADLKFTWNLLDFGVSYLQAKQEANRYLLSELGRKKVMLNLLKQTRSTYWRAAAMQDVKNQLDDLLKNAKANLEQLDKARKKKLLSPINLLNKKRALLTIIQKLEEMQHKANLAKVDLAKLMNVSPNSSFQLIIPDDRTLPELPLDLDTLELMSLVNSTEYQSQLYNIKINQLESRKDLQRIIPGIEFSYAANYDSNRFIFNNYWADAGFHANWNIMNLFTLGIRQEYSKNRDQLADARKLAVNFAVISQLHLSWQGYANTKDRVALANELSGIDNQLANLTRQAKSASATTSTESIQKDAQALQSRFGMLMAFAEAQDAYGTFLASLGLNPVPTNYQQISVAELTPIIEEKLALWEKGALPALPEIDTSGAELADNSTE